MCIRDRVISESGAYHIAHYFGLAISSVTLVHFDCRQLPAGIRSAVCCVDSRRCPPRGSGRAHPVKGVPRISVINVMIEMDDGDIT